MNEELQSTNEELETINIELRQRTQEQNSTNAFLQSILGSLTVGVVVIDRSLNVLAWNRQAQSMWGLRAEEVLGRSILSLDIGLPVEQLSLHQFLVGKSARQMLNVDSVSRRGKMIRCEVSCSQLLGPSGQQEGIIVLMEDITEREAMATAAASNEEHCRMVLAHAHVVVATQDAGLRYTWVHVPASVGLPQIVAGSRDADCLPADDAARLAAIKRKVMDNGEGQRQDCWAKVDGHPRCIDLSVNPLRDAAGQVAGVTCAMMDVTEVRLAERALQQSDELRHFIVGNAALVTWSVLPGGQLNDCNEAWSGYTGLSAESGQGTGWNRAIHPDDLPHLLESWQQPEGTSAGREAEFRLRRAADGKYRRHLAWIQPMFDDGGAVACWANTAVDVQDRTQESSG